MGKSQHDRCADCGKKKGRKNLVGVLVEKDGSPPSTRLLCKRCKKRRDPHKMSKDDKIYLADMMRDLHIAQVMIHIYSGTASESDFDPQDVAKALKHYDFSKHGLADAEYCARHYEKEIIKIKKQSNPKERKSRLMLHLPPGAPRAIRTEYGYKH